MPLSNKDLSNIAKEFAVTKQDQADSKTSIVNVQAQVVKKQDQATRNYILYNNSQVERATPYETEHRWLDGTTYTTITQSQIETFGADGRATYFFPLSWQKNNPKLTDNGNGNPHTTSTNSESFILNTTLENKGLINSINLLRNGQSSGASSKILSSPYSPGDPSIDLTISPSFTVGRVLYIAGSGTSALVRITGIGGTIVAIDEIIPPAGVISAGGSVVENISGFTNTERNTLVTSPYQRILTELTNNIKSSAATWNTALTNQLVQLKINIDSPSQITTAKNSVITAQTAYSTWFVLSDTGSSGKFVDTSLNNLTSAYSTRNSGISTRASQITAALGSVTQNSLGILSGSGVYLQRFKTMGYLINTADGALFQLNGLRQANTNLEDKVTNATDKLATYTNVVKYGAGTKDPVGNTLEISGISQFSISDAVVLTANDLAAINCTIINISGNIVMLSATIPSTYTKATKIGIIKAV